MNILEAVWTILTGTAIIVALCVWFASCIPDDGDNW